MVTIKCKERMRNERRMRERLKKRPGLLEKPMTKILDVPGEMIRETRVGNVTKIKYCDKAHGGSPVTFIIPKEKKKKVKLIQGKMMLETLKVQAIHRLR